MDGLSLLYGLRNLINEDVSSAFLDDRTSYEYLWQAAKTFASRAGVLKATQSITTVADQTSYTLNADFDKLYLMDEDKNFIIKYSDGTTQTFPTFKSYDSVVYENNTTSINVPSNFTLLDAALDSQITGTATSTAAPVGGLTTLTDTAGNFTNANVGDVIHNVTTGASGYIISKTSTTVIATAMFNGSSTSWTSADSYVIQPQGKVQLIIDPPPSIAGDTITVYYNQIPAPVFSDYGMYRIQQKYIPLLIQYAAWLYKYRDREPDFGDKFYVQFDQGVREANSSFNRSLSKNITSVSFRKR